ncbi:hypothetical protein GGX14DRAFT_403244 [Mycena pura]|uniref:Uncharacterized protein n=1 Tax=Mycena pura TaxID=153505 RepID=A0AAD6Y1D1_9AGAR|nr:hypothetical protein GGX14DRAFT_403244 [Mycena pura]
MVSPIQLQFSVHNTSGVTVSVSGGNVTDQILKPGQGVTMTVASLLQPNASDVRHVQVAILTAKKAVADMLYWPNKPHPNITLSKAVENFYYPKTDVSLPNGSAAFKTPSKSSEHPEASEVSRSYYKVPLSRRVMVCKSHPVMSRAYRHRRRRRRQWARACRRRRRTGGQRLRQRMAQAHRRRRQTAQAAQVHRSIGGRRRRRRRRAAGCGGKQAVEAAQAAGPLVATACAALGLRAAPHLRRLPPACRSAACAARLPYLPTPAPPQTAIVCVIRCLRAPPRLCCPPPAACASAAGRLRASAARSPYPEARRRAVPTARATPAQRAADGSRVPRNDPRAVRHTPWSSRASAASRSAGDPAHCSQTMTLLDNGNKGCHGTLQKSF